MKNKQIILSFQINFKMIKFNFNAFVLQLLPRVYNFFIKIYSKLIDEIQSIIDYLKKQP